VNVAPTPLYKPNMPFSRYNCNANCRALGAGLPSKYLERKDDDNNNKTEEI